MIIGSGFGNHPKIELIRLPDAPDQNLAISRVFNNKSITVGDIQASDQSVKFVVPQTFQRGIFSVRITNGLSSAVWRLNSPTIYWAQGDLGGKASPGGWIRVFGRCLGNTAGPSLLSMQSQTSKQIFRIQSQSSNPWEARFQVPSTMKPGVYDVKLYNGWGDKNCWERIGQFMVATVAKWPETVFNVRDFGAIGDGVANDTRAISATLEAAGKNRGGIVYFPRGRYWISEPLIIPRFVTLRGQGRRLVSLFWKDFKKQPPAYLIYGNNHFSLEDITLYASNYRNFIGSDLKQTKAGKPGYVSMQRVTVRGNSYRGHLKPAEIDRRFRNSLKLSTGGGDTIRLGGENISIHDCDIYGSGRSFYFLNPTNSYVSHNRFYNGRWGWYCITSADGLIFENNIIQGADLMSTGGSINAGNKDIAYSRNIFFGHNKFRLLFGWDREAMTSDAAGGFYYGKVKHPSGKTVTLAGKPTARPGARNGWKGAGVFILGGKGMGQFAQVAHIHEDVISLDRPWKVLPDNTSVVSITMMQQNYIFFDNEFTDAGVALQYYGTSINHLASGNKSIRTGGYYNSGRWYHHYQPSWYCQFLDNEILEGNSYRGGPNNTSVAGEAFIGTWGLQRSPNTAPLALGAVIRRNHLYSNAHIEVRGGRNPMAPGTRDVIVQDNIIEHADVGVKIDSGCSGILTKGNVFNDVRVPQAFTPQR